MFARKSVFRMLLVVVGTLMLAGTFYAFAAANVVPESGAGYDSEFISGYTVSDIGYKMVDDTTREVSFVLTPTSGTTAPTVVNAQVDTVEGTFYDCTVAAGTWTCVLGVVDEGLNTVDLDQLTVVASTGGTFTFTPIP